MSKFISYINANATKTIISRGKELFKDNHAKIITISKTTALVKVKKSSGTGFYEVEISDIDQLNPDNIGSFCNCPYDDFCKHEVAALLLLNSQINLPTDKKEVVTEGSIATASDDPIDSNNKQMAQLIGFNIIYNVYFVFFFGSKEYLIKKKSK